ncbi:hypothetical protein [Lysobacter capsici]|uniref:hypothetical protein n=1 Tax=Lysobacter capsici TaxID=435897 RepID=UPI000627E261|nr:hypothetical protein [Lysobacter capsici]
MGWARNYIARLQAGETVAFRPTGGSMTGKIESGQLCTVAPVDTATLRVGDIVLCRVDSNDYLHLVKAINAGEFQIGNNRGFINGWIAASDIFGKCVRIEP